VEIKTDSYKTQVLSSFHEIAEIKEEWEAFLRNEAESFNFWQDPNIIPLNINYCGNESPLIILLRRNGKIKCIVPCVLQKTKFLFQFSVFRIPGPLLRVLKIINSSLIFSKSADKEKCLILAFIELKKLRKQYDVIKLDTLENSTPLDHFFSKQKGNRHKCFQLMKSSPRKECIWRHIFTDSYDDWLSSLNSKTRYSIKTEIKRFNKKFSNQIEFRRITKREEVVEFLDLLDEIYPHTWQAKTFGLSKRNMARDITFYQGVSELGCHRSYMLLVNSKPVAYVIGAQYNKEYGGPELGYDAEFSGAGSVLRYMVLKDLYTLDKPAIMNFGFGDSRYKKIICHTKNDAAEVYIVQPNIWKMLIRLQIAINHIEKRTRELLIKYKLDKMMRKLLKHQ